MSGWFIYYKVLGGQGKRPHSVCHKPTLSMRFNRQLEDGYRDDQCLLKYWGIMYIDQAEALNYFGQV